MVCTIDDCEKLEDSKGWCKSHYDAWRRHGDPLLYKGYMRQWSVWQKIQNIGWTKTASGCLEYNGSRDKNGYGQLTHSNSKGFKRTKVHREVYKNLIGSLEPNEVVMHSCDNPPCGNPEHLSKGSISDNIKDMWKKGRSATSNLTVCRRGHPYPADRPPGRMFSQRCKICRNIRSRENYHRKKQYAS